MRPEDDFEAYVAARWPLLVRVLALLGCPDELLPEVVVDGLARCRRSWAATVRRGDAEVVVLAAVLAAWEERRRSPWWEGLAAPQPDPDRDAASEVLDAMPERERAAVVLHEVGGLDPSRVATTLDADEVAVRAALDPAVDAGLLARAAGSVDVLAPSYDAIGGRVRVRRRRRRRRALGVVAAVAVVVGTATSVTWATREEPARPETFPQVEARPEANPVDAVWFASGELHLPDATVRVPVVLDLVEVADGAVYLDEDGRVVRVDARGRRTALGRADPAPGVVGSVAGAQVAWRDAASGDLVVHDVADDQEVARVEGVSLEPVSIDDDRLYYNGPSGSSVLTLPDGESRPVESQRLLDVRAGTLLFQVDRTHVRLSRPAAHQEQVGRGVGGRLSDDGRLALTTVADRPVVRDILGGTADPGLTPGEVALAARLGRDGTIVLVVVPADQPEPPDETFGRLSSAGYWDLRTCVLGTGDCVRGARVTAAGSIPLFAG